MLGKLHCTGAVIATAVIGMASPRAVSLKRNPALPPCAIRIRGTCKDNSATAHVVGRGWFDDGLFGGAGDAATCQRRAASWQDTCGSLAKVEWHIEGRPDVPDRMLRFEICGGLANQRLALIQGIMIAGITGRHVELPKLNPVGVQDASRGYREDRSVMLDFGYFYDREALVVALNEMGIGVVPASLNFSYATEYPLVDSMKIGNLRSPAWCRKRISTESWLVKLNCPLFAVGIKGSAVLERMFWRVDAALTYAKGIRVIADEIVAELRKRSVARGADGEFNALHLRVEQDWVTHCKHWETHVGEFPKDNCMTNTDVLNNVLAIEGISNKPPLYVSSGGINGSASNMYESIRGLSALLQPSARYEIVSKESLAGNLLARYSPQRHRDLLAAIDAAVCSAARSFVGNSVSTFSALELLRRSRVNARTRTITEPQHGRAPPSAVHYNGGNNPLEGVLFEDEQREGFEAVVIETPTKLQDRAPPAHDIHGNLLICELNHENHIGRSPNVQRYRGSAPLKWIFTLSNTKRGAGRFEAIAKAAVVSALRNTNLVPVCIYYGPQGHLSRWLEGKGVRMIYHTPEWRDRLVAGLEAGRAIGLATKSTHYNNPSSAIGTFLRVDIPILGFTDDFVLYANANVYFAADITVADFGERPRYIRMGAEADALTTVFRNGTGQRAVSGNAGIMLMNVAGLRRTYKDFVDFTFSEDSIARGLHFGVPYGPLDQGAYNKFYEGRFQVERLPLFNWKPYWGRCDNARIIHFHGPKPSEYLHYINHGNLNISKDCSISKARLPFLQVCAGAKGAKRPWFMKWQTRGRRIVAQGCKQIIQSYFDTLAGPSPGQKWSGVL